MEHIVDVALKMAYRWCHLGDDQASQNEISEVLKDALCIQLGDEGFIDWLESVQHDIEQTGKKRP